MYDSEWILHLHSFLKILFVLFSKSLPFLVVGSIVLSVVCGEGFVSESGARAAVCGRRISVSYGDVIGSLGCIALDPRVPCAQASRIH